MYVKLGGNTIGQGFPTPTYTFTDAYWTVLSNLYCDFVNCGHCFIEIYNDNNWWQNVETDYAYCEEEISQCSFPRLECPFGYEYQTGK